MTDVTAETSCWFISLVEIASPEVSRKRKESPTSDPTLRDLQPTIGKAWNKTMRKPRRSDRRTVLKTLGAGAIGTVGSVGTAAASDDTLANELNTVRASTQKYRDVQTARDNGYGFFGVVKFVGVVFANPENLGNLGHTEDPTLLFYAPTRNAEIGDEEDVEDTNTILAGLEYHVTREEDGSPPNIFDDENADRNLKVTEEEGWHPNTLPFGEEGSGVDVFGLHVWAHLQNPNGVFALEHSTIRDHLTE